jgi:hypothetical protein
MARHRTVNTTRSVPSGVRLYLRKVQTAVRLVRQDGVRSVYRWIMGMYLPELFAFPNLNASRIDSRIYVGPQYGKLGKCWLRLHGIQHCVNMRGEFDSAQHGLALDHYCHPPTCGSFIDQLSVAARFIHGAVSAGHAVYVHCKHGKNRSPAAVIAYLITRGLTVEDAVSFVSQKRSLEIAPFHLVQLKRFEEIVHAGRTGGQVDRGDRLAA